MSKLFKLFILLWLSTLSLCCATTAMLALPPPAWNPAALFQSTAMVQFQTAGEGTTGTAWAIDNSHLITAGHVCENIFEIADKHHIKPDAVLMTAKDDNWIGWWGPVRPVAIDHVRDLCILYAPGHPLTPLPLEKDFSLLAHRGDKVWNLGAPLLLFPTLTECFLSSKWGLEYLPHLTDPRGIITSCPVQHGNSGSPVVNDQGHVIGIVDQAHPEYEHWSWGPNALTIQQFLDEAL